MIGPLTKRNRTTRRRSLGVTTPQPTARIGVASVTVNAAVVTVEFDQVVAVNGVPNYTTDVAGATAESVTQTSPTTIEITFSATVAAATELNIPYEEPAVRNSSGGFVTPSTFPVGA